MTPEQIRAAIIEYMTKKPGSIPNYSTVGGYEAAEPVFRALQAEGRIVDGIRLSPTGRRMGTLFLAEFAHLSA